MDTTISLKLPPKNYRRIIEELSVVFPDPALKLKFLKQAIDEHQKISAPYKLYTPIAGMAYRKKLLDNAEQIWPGSKKAAKNLIRPDDLPASSIRLGRLYKLRYIIGSAILIFLILGISIAVAPFRRGFEPGPPIILKFRFTNTTNPKIIIRKPIFYAQRSKSGDSPNSHAVKRTNDKKWEDQVSWYDKNPILTALATQDFKKPSSNRFSQKSDFSALPPSSDNHLTSSKIKPANYQNGVDQIPTFFQSPILAALKSQQFMNSISKPNAPPPVRVSRMRGNRNQPPAIAAKSAKHQASAVCVPKHLQSPILLSLTPQKSQRAASDHLNKKTISSPQPSQGKKLKSSPNVKSVKFRNGVGQVPNYLQNPILLALTPQHTQNAKANRIISKPLSSSETPAHKNKSVSIIVKTAKVSDKPKPIPKYLKNPIWLVEKTPDREFYSNRLQIITTHTISNLTREYYRFSKKNRQLPVNPKATNKISGIVYHASESDLYPFMPEMNHSILKYSKKLIKFLLRNKSYHYFIDRFGRVYRLVRDDHAAFHAGNSIWADEKEIYLNLNHAFIGICFEGKDFEEIKTRRQKKGQSKKSKSTRLKPTGISSFNEAQLRSGKELTDWLRVKYNISQHNCVPHALTSINPNRMLIGWHLDLARGFPFAKFGLSDKYQEPLPSMVEFGFHYDRYFKSIFNNELWRGIHHSEDIIKRQAKNSNMSIAKYRKQLQRRFSRYREWNKKMLEKKNQLAKKTSKDEGEKRSAKIREKVVI